jgi:hypothetical protein
MKVQTKEAMEPQYRQVVIDLMKKHMAMELMTADIYGVSQMITRECQP